MNDKQIKDRLNERIVLEALQNSRLDEKSCGWKDL